MRAMRLFVSATSVLAAAVLLEATAFAAGPVRSVGSVTPAAPPPTVWAWVVARNASSALNVPYTPTAKNRGNSSGGTNTVTRTATGIYEVVMPGVSESSAANGGMFHVSALDPNRHYCTVGGWGAGEHVTIDCYDAQGNLANTRFSVNWLDSSSRDSGKVAYLWDDAPTDTDTTGDAAYTFNSTGGANQIHRTGTGHWFVKFPGLGSQHGNVQVVAYDSSDVCRVIGWGPEGSDQVVEVVCRTPSGVLDDTEFDVTFVQNVALKTVHAPGQAYVWADRPTASSYHPAAAYSYSSAGSTATITRGGTGRYAVTLPGMPGGGSVQLTTYGTGTKRCVLTSIALTTPQKVGVRCYASNGTAADAKFVLAYTH